MLHALAEHTGNNHFAFSTDCICATDRHFEKGAAANFRDHQERQGRTFIGGDHLSQGYTEGSGRVILRGNRSASGNNQPLYVIDGIPISNATNANGQPGGTYGGTPDGGDGISNLNPEDIASISVLEGASGGTRLVGCG